MTDPHAKAMEAAYSAFDNVFREPTIEYSVAAYLAAMRAEGWVMVRDVGEMSQRDAVNLGVKAGYQRVYAAAHNACRAAMLKGDGDGQG